MFYYLPFYSNKEPFVSKKSKDVSNVCTILSVYCANKRMPDVNKQLIHLVLMDKNKYILILFEIMKCQSVQRLQ